MHLHITNEVASPVVACRLPAAAGRRSAPESSGVRPTARQWSNRGRGQGVVVRLDLLLLLVICDVLVINVYTPSTKRK